MVFHVFYSILISLFCFATYVFAVKKQIKDDNIKLKKDDKAAIVKEIAKLAAIVFLANVLIAASVCLKLVAVIGMVFACAYFVYVYARMLSAHGMKGVISMGLLVIPMAYNVMYCRAAIADGEYDHQGYLIKAFFWWLILPLILAVVVAIVRYCQLKYQTSSSEKNLVSRIAERFLGDEFDYEYSDEPNEPESSEAEPSEPENPPEDGGDDQSQSFSGRMEDISSYSPEAKARAKRDQWIYFVCAAVVLLTIAVCATVMIIMK